MIVWLNGTFGAGKTTTARELVTRLPDARVFGAEHVGFLLRQVHPEPLKLVLIEGEPEQPTVMDHLGVEVFSADDVTAATTRLQEAGLLTVSENNTECCNALQDKVWVHGPGTEPCGSVRENRSRCSLERI
jgi:hypothetical protein